jgi:hypothetical protein
MKERNTERSSVPREAAAEPIQKVLRRHCRYAPARSGRYRRDLLNVGCAQAPADAGGIERL